METVGNYYPPNTTVSLEATVSCRKLLEALLIKHASLVEFNDGSIPLGLSLNPEL
jgi:hypothetical protein